MFTLPWEGGYVNHPSDPGGATNRGVTWRVYNAYRRAKGLAIRSVAKITNKEVHAIYHQRYWIKAHCNELPDDIAIAVFDYAVNSGVRRAIRELQRVVGTTADGWWGPKTEAAVKTFLLLRGERRLTTAYLYRRERFFRYLARKRRFKVFLKGWLNRLNSLRTFLGVK